jgi:phospholipid/cholesterol/gamma-HCH transport system substrate-binding protein
LLNRQIKVGLFVVCGLVLVALGIFLIGENTRFWESKVSYRAAFHDVAGLKPGAPVRSGGLDVGVVSDVGHAETTSDTRIYVSLSITKDEAPRIRDDTVASIVSKGLLGDKMVELSVSDGRAPRLDHHTLIKSEEPADMFASANELAAKTQKVVESLEPLAQRLSDPKLSDDIKGTVESLHDITDAIAHQDSVVHRLLYDPKEAQKLDTALTNLDTTTEHLDHIFGDLQDVSEHVKSGPGIAHALVYDGEISANAAGALDEVHKDLTAIREGNGFAHALLYGDDPSQHVMSNLNAISDDVRTIVANVKAGKGTLGALLVDPSLYEDVKQVVGNVNRNQVLRALVRYSIKENEEERPHVKTPTAAAPAP